MKINFFLYILLIGFLFSCDKKQSIDPEKQIIKSTNDSTEISILNPEIETLTNWINYYRNEVDSSFSLENFKLQSIEKLPKIKGSVYGIFDEHFDEIYKEFIVYSPNRQNYVDFDSYQWSFDSIKKQLVYEADQEINLVKIFENKVERIGFRGPSYRVENAYWQNDSIIILLENSSDKVPTINKIDINSMKITTFNYQDTLKKASDFSNIRIKKKLKIYLEKDHTKLLD